MSNPSEYPEQLDDQSMGSQSNGLPAIAPIVPCAIEEPGSSLVPQEVHPPRKHCSATRASLYMCHSFIGTTMGQKGWMWTGMPGIRLWTWRTFYIPLVAKQRHERWNYGGRV